MSVALDHLVLAARTLDEGAAWCEATFSMTPAPGGRHPLVGRAGRLRWHISVRPDGRRLCGGALPIWIEWGETHPTDHMAASGVVLQALALADVPADAWAVLDLPAGVTATAAPGAPALQATFTSPKGPVVLRSPEELE